MPRSDRFSSSALEPRTWWRCGLQVAEVLYGALMARLALGVVASVLAIAAGLSLADMVIRASDAAAREAAAKSNRLVHVDIGAIALRVPGKWVTSVDTMPDGEDMYAIEFAVSYADLMAGIGVTPRAEDAVPLRIRIQRSDRAVSADHLLRAVHWPATDQAGEKFGPAGLIARPYFRSTGYGLEVLYAGVENGRQFWARCLNTSGNTISGSCLRIISISETVEVVVAFPYALLGDWRRLDVVVEALLQGLSSSEG